jgi:transposase
VRENFERWEELICFDRFHVSQQFNQGLDKVRRKEHGELADGKGNSVLTGSRFDWLVNSDRTDNRSGKRKAFLNLSRRHLKTARAWRIKETASTLWDYVYMKVAKEAWKNLLRWISRCRLPEMITVGKTVWNYFWGMLNAIRLRATNGALEATNGSTD